MASRSPAKMVPQTQEVKQVPAARAGYRRNESAVTKSHGAVFFNCGISGIRRAQSVLLFLTFTSCSVLRQAVGPTDKLSLCGHHSMIYTSAQAAPAWLESFGFKPVFTMRFGAADSRIEASARCAGRVKGVRYGVHHFLWCRIYKN